MTIRFEKKLDARLRERAGAKGLTVSAYIERLVESDYSAEDELESLAVEGLNSGAPLSVGPDYWPEKHNRLDQRLKIVPPVR